MSDAFVDDADSLVCAAGIRGPVALDDVLFLARKACAIGPVQVVRADRVVGFDHVRAAAVRAHRAFAQGTNQAERLEVEFTRYLAGERQIRTALDKMGVPDGAPAAIVVGLGPNRKDAVRYYLHASGARTDGALLEPTDAALHAFGVTPAQRAATTPDKQRELVLEAVAAVDLLR